MVLGNPDKAVEAYSLGFAAGAAHWSGLLDSAGRCGVLNMLEETYGRAFSANGEPAAGVVLFEIQSARGDCSGMLDTAQHLVNGSPAEPTFWLRIGEANERLGNLETATAAYHKAVSIGRPDAASVANARIEAIKSQTAGADDSCSDADRP